MDLDEYWQENKRFVTSVASGGVLFLIGLWGVNSYFEGDINAKRRVIGQRKADLAKPMYTSSDLADARTENEALQEAVAALRNATHFKPREEFLLGDSSISASNHYLRVLNRVREDLIPRANRSNLQVDQGLGMPRLSPTREVEIERYLEALDVIETVIGMAIDARVDRIDRIQIKLDPGLSSTDGVGDVEKTRITFDVTGTSVALTTLLTRTQRTEDDRSLHVEEVAMTPSRSKQDEVRLELQLVVARLAEPVEPDQEEG